MPAKAHYRGTYQRRAKAVRAQAYANPSTRCWRCGRTRAQHQRRWHAGHVNDGQIDGPLLAECEQCNTAAGARLGNRLRAGFRTTRQW